MQDTGTLGFVDLLIESNPPRNCFTVLEIKNMQIDYVDLRGSPRYKAAQLVAMSLTEILKLGLTSNFHPPTVEEWLEGDKIRKQLYSYVAGPTVEAKEKVHAYMVVIIGSRHILIREMDGEGEWTGDWKLVGKEQEAPPMRLGRTTTPESWLYRTKSGFPIIHRRLRTRGHYRRQNIIIQR